MGERSILTIKEYSRVRIKLNEALQRDGRTRNQLATAMNVRFEVVDKWCNGNVERMDLDVLARACYVLDCGVGDILEYVRPEE